MSKILFIGGDVRQKIAANSLEKQGYEVSRIIDEKDILVPLNDFKVIVLPVPTTKDNTLLYTPLMDKKIALNKIIEQMSSEQLLITGNYTLGMNNCFDICKRDDFALLNAIPTAEGAIALAMQNTDFTIFGSNILVIGNGKCGRILAKKLLALGANVTVSARRNKDFVLLKSEKIPYINTYELSGNLNDFDIIFNTVPSMVLNENTLKGCKAGCLLIELASAPFGIDKTVAISLDLKYIYAPALPGKVAPRSAGEFLATSINNLLSDNNIYPAKN